MGGRKWNVPGLSHTSLTSAITRELLAYSSLGSRFATCPQGTSDSGALIDAYYASSGRALDFKVCMVE